MLVYRVTNTVNGKVYIGKWSHPTVDHRWRLHKSAAKSGSPYYFHRAIRKYGADTFKVEVIDWAKTAEELSQMEMSYIALYQSNDPKRGYNMTLGGDGHNGWVPSEAWKKWKSAHSKALWSDPGYCALQAQSHKNWWTLERRKENAYRLRLRRMAGCDPRKGTGKGPGTGKKHSAATCAKLSAMRNIQVRCLDTGETFPSLTYATERLGGCGGNLSRAIKRGYRFLGRRYEYV